MSDTPQPTYPEPPEWFTQNERDMWFRMGHVEAQLKEEQRRGAMLVEAIQSERRERETERAMWKDIVALLKRQNELTEQDIAAIQTVLKIVSHCGCTHLRALLDWVWKRSTPDEIISMRGMRDALWQVVGLLEGFNPDARP